MFVCLLACIAVCSATFGKLGGGGGGGGGWSSGGGGGGYGGSSKGIIKNKSVKWKVKSEKLNNWKFEVAKCVWKK